MAAEGVVHDLEPRLPIDGTRTEQPDELGLLLQKRADVVHLLADHEAQFLIPRQLVQALAVFPRQARHDASPALLINSSTSSRWSSALISRSTMRPAMSAAMPEISPISSE